jgi:hypothetical protein
MVLEFRRVHCITFGAPPITTSPVLRPELPPFQTGLFFNVVNEEDPVPLMQPAYVNSLLTFFTLNDEDLKKHLAEKHPNGFTLPAAFFRVTEPCIVLRADDATDVDAVGWNAVKIQGEKLERKLFGNPAVHSMEEGYLVRIRYLVKQMGHGE